MVRNYINTICFRWRSVMRFRARMKLNYGRLFLVIFSGITCHLFYVVLQGVGLCAPHISKLAKSKMKGPFAFASPLNPSESRSLKMKRLQFLYCTVAVLWIIWTNGNGSFTHQSWNRRISGQLMTLVLLTVLFKIKHESPGIIFRTIFQIVLLHCPESMQHLLTSSPLFHLKTSVANLILALGHTLLSTQFKFAS